MAKKEKINSLEVSIDGVVFGVYVPAKGHLFSAILGNIPGKTAYSLGSAIYAIFANSE